MAAVVLPEPPLPKKVTNLGGLTSPAAALTVGINFLGLILALLI